MAMAADGRGWPWKLLGLDVRGSYRGNCRGIPRTSVPLQLPRKLQCKFPRVSVSYHGWCDGTCHGQNRGTCCGNCGGIPRTSVVIAAYRRIAVEMVPDDRGWPWKLLETAEVGRPRKQPWQMPRTSADFRGWYGVCHGQNRGTCRGHSCGICCRSAMSRGTCRRNPRISTVARCNTHRCSRKFRGHCRGPLRKSQIMCIRAVRAPVAR